MRAFLKGITLAVLFTVAMVFAANATYGQTEGDKSATASPGKHPIAITDKPVCSQCHTDERIMADHTVGWATNHKFSAGQSFSTCNLCHKASYCVDCHANRDEVKPSDKYKDQPWRALPHRGDYISRHRIDGRINPAACFRCHGRMNNERCKTCHR